MSNGIKKYVKKLLQIGQYSGFFATAWIMGEIPVFAQAIDIKPNFKPNPLFIEKEGNGSVLATEVSKQKETATGICVGFVSSRPNHVLKLTSFFNLLKVSVESVQDTTIVVKGPGGIWCNDDYQNKNPGIAGQWQAGEYSIWIGSYKQNDSFPYLLKITQGNK